MTGNDRGHYKVFLGMAAGVGKTYRMLQEGSAEKQAGRDIVIGYLESHRRVETQAQAEGLETLPRRRVEYGERLLEEMDLPGLLSRAPELALIDELAHTNAPGLEHQKRYEDIEDVLDAGIDVFSTVNVQHLESLNDSIAEMTGVRVRETFPDTALTAADEVVLIDLTPEALIQRLREGKVYPPERVETALNNFFKVENLSTLREVALRQVAEEVEVKRSAAAAVEPVGTREERLIDEAPVAVAERVLALVSARPRSQRLVRRAWRSAQRLGADLDLLHVTSKSLRARDEESEELKSLRRLASVLGAHLIVEDGDDLSDVAARVAAERGTTYVMIGRPRSAQGLRRFGESLPEKLIRKIPGVDIRIVADRGRLEEKTR
ncbi:MAG TPA: sensor histidine kinase KdpD [Thermoleophilaceae bacterium]|jgi:two-component system sensor histidine kinase KdpD